MILFSRATKSLGERIFFHWSRRLQALSRYPSPIVNCMDGRNEVIELGVGFCGTRREPDETSARMIEGCEAKQRMSDQVTL
jgi:hypothetical protein